MHFFKIVSFFKSKIPNSYCFEILPYPFIGREDAIQFYVFACSKEEADKKASKFTRKLLKRGLHINGLICFDVQVKRIPKEAFI